RRGERREVDADGTEVLALVASSRQAVAGQPLGVGRHAGQAHAGAAVAGTGSRARRRPRRGAPRARLASVAGDEHMGGERHAQRELAGALVEATAAGAREGVDDTGREAAVRDRQRRSEVASNVGAVDPATAAVARREAADAAGTGSYQDAAR